MKIAYKKRWATPLLLQAVKEEPVVVVTGPRQVGKSTLINHCLPKQEWRSLTLDDFDVLEQAKRDPTALLASPQPVILDEVQRVPDLLLAVKQVVDQSHRKRRIVLSGSANLLLMEKVSESLAGRAVFMTLRPFSYGELQERSIHKLLTDVFSGKIPKGIKTPAIGKEELLKQCAQGWMPIVALRKSQTAISRWWEGYLRSYLERDLRQLSQIDALGDFRNLMASIALRSGSLVNQNEMSRQLGISQPTIHRYINLLIASALAEKLPAYQVNRNKRLIKTPKIYFVDSGLAAFLAGFELNTTWEDKFWGALLETALYHHLKLWCELQTPQAQLYYWRTSNGTEVDFVLEKGREKIAIELKATDRPSFAHVASLKLFLEEYPKTRAGILVHTGSKVEQLGERIYAVPWEQLI